MRTWERGAAWLLLLNGALGLCVGLGAAFYQGTAPAVLWSVLGLLAGALAMRAPVLGLAVGLLYYVPQVLSFHGSDVSFSVRSGISLAWAVHLTAGVLVINLAALALALLNVFLVVRRPTRNPEKGG
jgi:hypothetical protein